MERFSEGGKGRVGEGVGESEENRYVKVRGRARKGEGGTEVEDTTTRDRKWMLGIQRLHSNGSWQISENLGDLVPHFAPGGTGIWLELNVRPSNQGNPGSCCQSNSTLHPALQRVPLCSTLSARKVCNGVDVYDARDHNSRMRKAVGKRACTFNEKEVRLNGVRYFNDVTQCREQGRECSWSELMCDRALASPCFSHSL